MDQPSNWVNMVVVKECIEQRMTYVLPNLGSEDRRWRLNTPIDLTQFTFSRIDIINEILLNHLDVVSVQIGKTILNVRIFVLKEFVFTDVVPILKVINILALRIIGLHGVN